MLKKQITKLLLLLSLVFISASPVEAKVILQEKGRVNIPAGEIINDDLFIGAESVDIAGTVTGDIYVGAGTVKFNGRVSGDLVVGAGTVNIVGATIGDSLIVGAGTLNIDDQSRIGGSLLAGSGTLDNQAAVGRNFMAGIGTLNFNAPVGGEARVAGETIAFGPKTMIKGDLNYFSENKLDEAIDEQVEGKIIKHEPAGYKRVDRKDAIKAWRSARLGLEVWSFTGALVAGLTIQWLLSKFSLGIAAKIQGKFLPSIGWGLVLLAVAPVGLILLALTGIGLPLAFIFGTLFFIDLYLAKIFASLALGQWLNRRFDWKFSLPAVYFIGLAVYYFLRLVPVVGFMVRLGALLAGLGGLWLYKQQLLAKKKA